MESQLHKCIYPSADGPVKTAMGVRSLRPTWFENETASRSATNSLSVSKLHCQECQRRRPTTGDSYMLISVAIDWSHCPCISLPPPKKRGGRPTWETGDLVA